MLWIIAGNVKLAQQRQSKIDPPEAMHSINRHWFGAMSRWLNKGIAQYARADQNVALKDTS
jgi:hypothetical protein